MHNWFVYHQSLWIICLWITAGNCAWNLMVGMLVCVLSALEVLTSYSSYTYFLSMHAFTSEGAAGKCIWSACIISKLVLINSRENVVHGPGKIETISLTALASRETQWTSEFVIPRGHAYSYFIFICKAKASYSTWAIASGASLREIPQDCCMLHKTWQFPRMTAFCLNFSVWMVSVQDGTLSFSQREQLCTGRDVAALLQCWMLLLETHTRAANTEGPQTPNIAFSFHPAAAELTDWCPNLVCRCLCCLRRASHPQ